MSQINAASTVLSQVLPRAFALLPEAMLSDKAAVMLLAIGLQESRLSARRQMEHGPARGLWQFEITGVTGVLNHHSSHRYALNICDMRGIDTVPVLIHDQLANDDVLAACFARLLLWTDAEPLPAIVDQEAGWQYYLRNWRPGRPRPADWPRNHSAAASVVTYAREFP